jgi:glycine betaine transporter
MTTREPQRILMATDFSVGSDEALDRAIELAKRSGATLEIVHVVEVAEELPFGATYFDSDYGSFYANVDQQLSVRAERAARAGIACTTKIIEGSAAVDILNRARELAADLIVVGTHGRTGLAHIVLGSVAERIVRRSSCPVLSVPFSKKQAAA